MWYGFHALSLSLFVFSMSLCHCESSVSLWLSASGETGDCYIYFFFTCFHKPWYIQTEWHISPWKRCYIGVVDTNSASSHFLSPPPSNTHTHLMACSLLQKIENPLNVHTPVESSVHIRRFPFQQQHTHTNTLALLNKLCSAAGLLCPMGQCVEQRHINHSERMCNQSKCVSICKVCL